MKRYVLGFMFSEDEKSVLLIKKAKPEWQAGRLNGIGGKIEQGEFCSEAMVREFQEETGVQTSCHEWRRFALISREGYVYKAESEDDYQMHCFSAFNTKHHYAARTTEAETVMRIPVGLNHYSTVPNVPWLIEMALNFRHGEQPEYLIQPMR